MNAKAARPYQAISSMSNQKGQDRNGSVNSSVDVGQACSLSPRQLDNVATRWPGCLRAVVAVAP